MNVAEQYHTGADTEQAGATKAAKSADAIRAKLLHLLADVGPMTDEEAFDAWEELYGIQSSTFFGNTFRRRRLELLKLGLVADSGVRRRSRAGIECIVWEAA